jgi:peptidoglycan/LPS O-acetylase OafA/YrhL
MGAIRLFLAYGVLLGHECGLAVDRGLTCDSSWAFNVIGGRAVIFFYIVSGFLMSYVLDRKYPATRTGTYQFFQSRFLRIYPLWWAVVAFSALTLHAQWPDQSSLQFFCSVILFGSDWIVSFATFPKAYMSFFAPGTEIGWTLGIELTFYLLAPWLLRFTRLALALLIGSAVLRAVALFVIGPDGPSYLIWSYFTLPSVLMFFLLGHFARRIPVVGTVGPWPSVAIFFSSLWFSSRNNWPPINDWFPMNFYLAAILFAVALPAIFDATKDNRLSNWLGDLTYPLYLTHTLFLWALFGKWQILGAPGEALVAFAKTLGSPYVASAFVLATLAILCVVAALIVHLIFERPLRRLSRHIIAAVADAAARVRAPSVSALSSAAEQTIASPAPSSAGPSSAIDPAIDGRVRASVIGNS